MIINPETMLKLELPLTKSYMNNEGYYHVAFSISTTEKEYYGDIITEAALKSMVSQAKQININANHQTGLEDIVGPVVDAWTETTDGVSYLWVDVRVRREWESTIKDMLDAGISLGGSIEAEITDYIETDDGTCYIDGIVLHGAALTTIPANNATLGTATSVVDGCPGSLCMQLEKHLKRKNMEVNKLPEENKTENKALNYYDKLLKDDPNNSIAWNNKGVQFIRQCKYLSALYCFDKSLGFNLGPAALYNRWILIKKENRHISEVCVNKALEIDPDLQNSKKEGYLILHPKTRML